MMKIELDEWLPRSGAKMTTQAEADEIGHQIGETGRKADREATDDSFGRINCDAFYAAIGMQDLPWERLEDEFKAPWIAAAAAVRKAEQELRDGAKP